MSADEVIFDLQDEVADLTARLAAAETALGHARVEVEEMEEGGRVLSDALHRQAEARRAAEAERDKAREMWQVDASWAAELRAQIRAAEARAEAAVKALEAEAAYHEEMRDREPPEWASNPENTMAEAVHGVAAQRLRDSLAALAASPVQEAPDA